MKKIGFLIYYIAIVFLPLQYTLAQSVSNYVFNPGSSIYTTLVSGQTIPLSGNLNDGYANNIPIGFTFIYNSEAYTSLSVSTNGFLCLGNAISNVANANNNLSTGAGTASPRPIIAPLWDNLNFNNVTDLRYSTLGNAPNRTFVMEWKNARWGASAASPGISFQSRLSEADGKIEFIYQAETGALNAPSASIGISNVGTGVKNFLCLTSTASNTSDTSTIVETTTLNTKPNNGQFYSFEPKFLAPNAPATLSYTNITGTQITLNWNDSSNSETYFLVYMSADDINYNLISSIPSSNTPGTGLAYQQNFTGLVPGNTYYFRVFACNEGSLPSNYAQGNISTAAGLLSGTKTICPTLCDYTSIGNACNDIRNKGVNGALILELMPSYSSSIETYPLVFGNLLTNTSNTITIRPHTTVTNPIIFTSNASSTFTFSQTNYLSIDGQVNGQGPGEFIQIYNSNSVGSAVNFINSSSFNNISYCRMLGRSQAINAGVISFLGSSFSEGNNQNSIFNNTIKDSINTPIYGIYSGGNTNAPNLFNSIYNNNIYNYHNGSNPSYGIQIATGSNAWFISNNSFFQTSTRNISASYAGAINLFAGSNYTLIGNYIGGSAAQCGGTTTQYTGNGYVNFIRLNLSASNTNVILGNYIQNIHLNWLGSSGINSLIHLINGAFNVSGNQLGSEQNNLKISINNSTGTIDFAAIYLGGGSAYEETQISYNTISGFNIGTTGLGNIQFAGIRVASAVPAMLITDNTIGSSTQANSIRNQSKAYTYGIVGPTVVSQTSILGNTIANLHADNTDSNANVCGIYINSAGSFNVSNNTIFKLFSRSVISQTGYSSPAVGIWHASSGPDQVCNYNTISNIYASNASNPSMNNVFGIRYINSSSGTNLLSNNFVHTLGSAAINGATIYGIQNSNKYCLAANNMIRLGIDSNGNNIVGNHSFIGIFDYNNTNSNSYYHNSVYIGGANNGPNNLNSFAFLNFDIASGTRNIINNIFYNNRTNSLPSSAKHYAISFAQFNINGLTLDHNIYFAPNSGGNFGRLNTNDYTNIQAWRSNTFMDFNSGIGNPNFLNPNGNSSNLSLKLQSNSAAEGSGMEIAEIETDFEGDPRQSNTPNDIGADAGNYNKVDIFAPSIDYLPLSNTNSTSNRTFNVTIKDADKGVNTSTSWRPRIYYRRLLPTTSAWQSMQGNLISGNSNAGVWSFTLDYGLTGLPVALGQRYQYYIVAQDSANPSNVFFNPFVGGNHVNVNSMVLAPSNAYTYNIVNGLPASLTVGSGQTYTSLTGATGLFAAINNGVLSGNTVATIVSNTTETGTVALTNSGLGGFTLLIKPDNNARIIAGSVNTGALGLVCLDGAAGVTIDGGTQKNFIFRNTIGTTPNANTAPTIRIRSGNNDTLRNCIIEGNSANSGIGTINLGTSSLVLPSEHLIIQNNIIRPPLNDSTNAPNTPIVINSAAGNITNSKVIGNMILDYNTIGLYVANAGENLSIGDSLESAKGNHFIQRIAKNTTHYAILVGSGNSSLIGHNKIYNLHNITHNIGLYGIYVFNGLNNTLITHNSIGGNSETRSGNPFRNSNFYTAILVNGGNLQNTRIENNNIGNILLNGSAGSFTGIYGIGGKLLIKNNTIGVAKTSLGLSDSISVGQSFYGIRYSSSSAVNITDNQIRNIFNNGPGFLVGVSLENGVFNIQNNEISHLLTRASNTNIVDYACVGLRVSSASADNNIENNLIYNLHNQSNLNGSTVTGMAIMSALKNSQVHRNRIYNLQANNTGLSNNSGVLRGIFISSNGSCIYHNNQISLAQDIFATQPIVRGIEVASSGGNNQFYYNNIYIGGVNYNPNNSSAFYRNTSSTTAAIEFLNNIFYNERLGAGSHYALSSNLSINTLQNNNLFVAKSTSALVEFPIGTVRSLNAWNAVTGNPIYNLSNTNIELLADSFFENKNTGNLKSNSCRINNAGSFVPIQHDFNNQPRLIPSDIGSNEFTISTGQAFITKQALNDTLTCSGGNVYFAIKASGAALKYQWQVKQSTLWLNLQDDAIYRGSDKDSLVLVAPNSTLHNNQYRCVVSGICSNVDTSIAVRLIVISNNNWTGAVNSQWSNPANWSCALVPTPNTNAIINNVSNLPVISDSTPTCFKLSIALGAQVTLNNIASKLDIYGPLELNGTLVNTIGTVSFSGNTLQDIPAIGYHNLTINNAAGVQLIGPTSVSNQLNFVDGTIRLNQFSLTILGTTANILGANSANKFIVTNDTGNLVIENIGASGRSGIVTFPIGSNPLSFTPFSIRNLGISDHFAGRVMAKVYNQYATSGAPIGPFFTANAVDKTWHVKEFLPGGSNANLTLTWNIADELIGFNRSVSYVGRYTGTQWVGNIPNTAGGANPYFQSLGTVTNFGQFGAASGGILPIHLLTFKGSVKDNLNHLYWQTASEKNSKSFEIEKSEDGLNFRLIGQVKASGNSEKSRHYRYIDNEITANSRHFYRLRLVDKDGSFSFSKSILLQAETLGSNKLNVYPNPFANYLIIESSNVIKETVEINLCDINGHVIYQKIIPFSNYYKLDNLNLLAPGIYIISIKNKEEVRRFKLLKN